MARTFICSLFALSLFATVGCEPNSVPQPSPNMPTAEIPNQSPKQKPSDISANDPADAASQDVANDVTNDVANNAANNITSTSDANSQTTPDTTSEQSDKPKNSSETTSPAADPSVPLSDTANANTSAATNSEPAETSGESEKGQSNDELNDSSKEASTPRVGSSIVPPSRAYLPPNRNTAPPPPLPAPKSEKELAEEKKIRDAAKKRGEITFDALVFDMEKDEVFEEKMLGPDNWDLHGKTWKLRGFILPTTLFSQTGITEFVLVRDNQECCFGPGAALFDCVIVTMAPGKSISYTTRVVTVKGKLEIDTESFRYPDDEGHYAVYKMTAEEVK